MKFHDRINIDNGVRSARGCCACLSSMETSFAPGNREEDTVYALFHYR